MNSKEYYQKNKKRIRKRNNLYWKNNKDKKSVKDRRYYIKHREYLIKKSQKWRINNQEKRKKQSKKRYILVQIKIKAQRLAQKIPLKKSCEICGEINNLERHHWDYNQSLLVNTLCKNCHQIQHIKYFYDSYYGRIL